MRVYFGLAIAAVLSLAGALRAEPLSLEQVSAEAKWVAHLDADAMRASTVADKVHEHWKQKHPKAEKHLAVISAIWNFNPLTDLHGVTLYDTKFIKDTGIGIVHAKVDQKLLLDMARRNPQYREETYGQYQLHVWLHRKGGKQKQNMVGALYRPNMIVFGYSIEEVKAALDVLDGSKPNLAEKKSPLAAPVPKGTMLLARVVDLDKAKNLPCKSPIVKQIESLSLAVGEQDGETFFKGRMSVKKPELAKEMKTFVDGARAMAAIVHMDDAETLELINALDIDVDGKVIEVEWQAPAEKVFKFLKKVEGMKKAHRDRMKLRLGAGLSLPEEDEDDDQE